MHAIESPSWELALSEFLENRATYFTPNTARFYKRQLSLLVRWAIENGIPFDRFGKREMDKYIALRRSKGLANRTLHHDGRTAKKFIAWCVEYGLLERSLLATWSVPKAEKAHVNTPSTEEVTAYLKAAKDFWNPEKNPRIRFEPASNRGFFRDRNYAFFFGLVETGCRIGEMCSLRLDDIKVKDLKLTFHKTKGNKFREIPISREWVAVLEVWLRVRARVTRTLDNDERYVFINEFGGRLDETVMGRTMGKVRNYAGLCHFTPHGFRHYTITKWSAVDLPAAQVYAGHEDIKTTAGYVDVTEQRLRGVHDRAGVAREVLAETRRPARRSLL